MSSNPQIVLNDVAGLGITLDLGPKSTLVMFGENRFIKVFPNGPDEKYFTMTIGSLKAAALAADEALAEAQRQRQVATHYISSIEWTNGSRRPAVRSVATGNVDVLFFSGNTDEYIRNTIANSYPSFVLAD